MKAKRQFFWIGLFNSVVVAICVALAAIKNEMAFLSAGMAIISIITFFGIMSGSKNLSDESRFRRAITFTVVTVYVVLISITAFFVGEWKSPQVTITLLTSFTSIVGVIVAFYFGSSAYLEAKSKSNACLLYTSPSPRDGLLSRMPSSA